MFKKCCNTSTSSVSDCPYKDDVCRSYFHAITDNEVDGTALFNLTESDIMAMFPGKIGAARKLIVLLNRVRPQSSSEVSYNA